MELFNGLPVFVLDLDTDETDTGVQAVALVDAPAIKRNFLKFREQRERVSFAVTNEERRIISGPLLIPDMLIYREDSKDKKYYLTFTKEAIQRTAIRFAQTGRQNVVNLMHQSGDNVDGLTMFESFITDTQRGVMPLAGYDDVPEGTWFGSFIVNNEEVWQDIKAEKIKGFSIEGAFDHKPMGDAEEPDEAEFQALREMVRPLYEEMQKLLIHI